MLSFYMVYKKWSIYFLVNINRNCLFYFLYNDENFKLFKICLFNIIWYERLIERDFKDRFVGLVLKILVIVVIFDSEYNLFFLEW